MRFPNRLLVVIIIFILSALVITSCNLFGGKATPTPFIDDGEEDPFIGMPNPASFYCQEMGYELEMRETDQGTVGFCIFPNGAECEEWEFFEGSCYIEWSFCQRQGYTIKSEEGMAICTFPDGSTCPEYDFFIGECQPPEN